MASKTNNQVVTLFIRNTDGVKIPMEMDLSGNPTLADLRVLVFAATGVPEEEQKLVYAGRILQGDDETCVSTFDLKNDGVVFLLRLKPPAQAVESNSTTNVSKSPFNASPQRDGDPIRAMISGPAMKWLTENPDLLHSIMMLDPRLRQLSDANPEIGHLMRDASFLRQMFEMQQNPAAMREMQRSQDRALANIEMHPGGFNALQKMYHTLAPLDDAAHSHSAVNAAEEAEQEVRRLAQQHDVRPIETHNLNTCPLPNIWSNPPTPSSNLLSGPRYPTGMSPTKFPYNDTLSLLSPLMPTNMLPPAPSNTLSPNLPRPTDALEKAITIWPSKLQHMEDMGFNRRDAAEALAKTEGDVDAAVNTLVLDMDRTD